MTRTVHVCLSAGTGSVIIDREGSTRDTRCAVLDVPEAILASEVILKMSRLIFFPPWPIELRWPEIAALSPGTIVRGSAP